MPRQDFRSKDDMSTLTIYHRGDVIEMSVTDIGNSASADIDIDEIWDVIDYLIEIAGPRAFAAAHD